VTRHKLGWGNEMPAFYTKYVRELPGVENAVGVRWGELKVPSADKVWFESSAVDVEPFIEMHYELAMPAEQKRAFLADRRGAIVSRKLAEEFHWKVGQKVNFIGEHPGNLELTISAIFESTRYGFAHRTIYFNLEYFNEILVPAERERINIVAARIRDPNAGARIARAIDIHFDDKEDRTFSQEDKALNASINGRHGAILEAVNVVSVLVLGVVLLILGNTMAMSSRERTLEYGVMRAIGFRPKHVIGLVLGEAAFMGLAGGALALPVSYPLLQGWVSRYFEETMYLPPLQVQSVAAASAVGFGVLLGVLAASLPAYRLARIDVVRSLRVED
jgi:putative ABC transport system permease protein